MNEQTSTTEAPAGDGPEVQNDPLDQALASEAAAIEEQSMTTPPASKTPPPAKTDVEPNFKGGATPAKAPASKAPASKKAAKPAAKKTGKAPASKAPAKKAPASKSTAKAKEPKAPRATKAGQFRAAAIKLLTGRKTPMTVKELTEQAIDKGLLTSAGKTPDRTMATLLYTDPTGTFERVVPEAAAGKTRANGVKWRLAPKGPAGS